MNIFQKLLTLAEALNRIKAPGASAEIKAGVQPPSANRDRSRYRKRTTTTRTDLGVVVTTSHEASQKAEFKLDTVPGAKQNSDQLTVHASAAADIGHSDASAVPNCASALDPEVKLDGDYLQRRATRVQTRKKARQQKYKQEKTSRNDKASRWELLELFARENAGLKSIASPAVLADEKGSDLDSARAEPTAATSVARVQNGFISSGDSVAQLEARLRAAGIPALLAQLGITETELALVRRMCCLDDMLDVCSYLTVANLICCISRLRSSRSRSVDGARLV